MTVLLATKSCGCTKIFFPQNAARTFVSSPLSSFMLSILTLHKPGSLGVQKKKANLASQAFTEQRRKPYMFSVFLFKSMLKPANHK